MATATAGILHSDQVNYLMFRYMQECGYEQAALAFCKEWQRLNEYRDPENLPFASLVNRQELISVIQDGLRFDQVQAKAARKDRRHKWVDIDPRAAVDRDVDMEDGMVGSRPSSSGKRKSLSVGISRQSQFPSPPNKRPRISAQDHVHINGHREAMDVDVRSPSAGDVEDEVDAISPALASEGAEPVPTFRYDSVLTQTETTPFLRHRTLVLPLERPEMKVWYASWRPRHKNGHDSPLLVAGDALCRLYQTPSHLNDDVQKIEHIDVPEVSGDALVTATAWHPKDDFAACALEPITPTGGQVTRELIEIGPDGTTRTYKQHTLLQPPGIAFNVKYSPSGDHILVAKTNETRSSVEIWSTAQPDALVPVAWRILDVPLSQAAWSSSSKITVCTRSKDIFVLTMLEEGAPQAVSQINQCNLTEQIVSLPDAGEASVEYRHDDIHQIDIFTVNAGDSSSGKLVLQDPTAYASNDYVSTRIVRDLHGSFYAAELQPAHQTDQNGSNGIVQNGRLLAALFETGRIELFEIGRSEEGILCQPLFEPGLSTYDLDHGPAIKAAWSPDGKILAVAGYDLVQIWEVKSTSQIDKRPVMKWMASKVFPADLEGDNPLRDKIRPVTLNWDANGEKLVFAVDEKLALIEIDIPRQTAEADANGV